MPVFIKIEYGYDHHVKKWYIDFYTDEKHSTTRFMTKKECHEIIHNQYMMTYKVRKDYR